MKFESSNADNLVYLIYFDDHDRRPEVIVGEVPARSRFDEVSQCWNAHLFVKVASNSRDDPYHDCNVQVGTAAEQEQFEREYDRLFKWRNAWTMLACDVDRMRSEGRLQTRQERIERRARIANGRITALMKQFSESRAQHATR